VNFGKKIKVAGLAMGFGNKVLVLGTGNMVMGEHEM